MRAPLPFLSMESEVNQGDNENIPPLPDFRSETFLKQHAAGIMDFYHPRCIDPDGGFFHYFRDDGSIYDRETRHLVSSTRFVFNYAMAWKTFKEERYLEGLRHGLDYLRKVHRDPESGGYIWELRNGEVTDTTQHCYGLAFTAIAYAKAVEAGVEEAEPWLEEVWDLMEEHFWEPRHGLYADEATRDWTVSNYRGQNPNMHACEAWLAAYEATGKARYLERAVLVADHIVNRQAALNHGLIWEHYDADWKVDWLYNYGDQSNIFRPWGYQPGHHVEWAKLLLILDRHLPADWRLPRARELFEHAVTTSWDDEFGGMVYGTGPDDKFCDDDKYYWVQTEASVTAALLAERTGEEAYWSWYQRLWEYSWKHLIDHRQGAWYRILKRNNEKYSDEKSPAGKTDYHTMGACYEILKGMQLGG
jgi:mannose/cellobiose epimerase-like protein (N-acyl-D-glucosamine 2-epimerase family)